MQLIMADIYPVRSWKNITVVGKRRMEVSQVCGLLSTQYLGPRRSKGPLPGSLTPGPSRESSALTPEQVASTTLHQRTESLDRDPAPSSRSGRRRQTLVLPSKRDGA